jgi:acetoin utilization deacetylase AcuC-like enzyme
MIKRRSSLALALVFLTASAAAWATPATAPKPKQEIWYHSGYPGGVVGPSSGMSARMGPTKMPVVFEAIRSQRLLPPGQIHVDASLLSGAAAPAAPIDLASLRAVHSDRYLKAILTGTPKELACSQGLPSWSPSVARGWLLNLGGLYAAATAALEKKTITANLGHGYHHAGVNRGEGYCTLNGLAVVAKKLLREGRARRVMVVDLDQHEGNGTAACTIGEAGILNVSIYGSNMGGPPATENNLVLKVKHASHGAGQARDVNYLSAISSRLPDLIRRHNPDLILYQAGMDPHDCAGITPEALAVRDAYVFAVARSFGKPVTWVLAGGYSSLEMLRRLHTGTVRAANEVLARVRPGDRIESSSSLGARPYSWSASAGKVSFPDWSTLLQAQGGPKLELPGRMTEAQTRAFVVERERLLQRERLLENDLQAAYRSLLSGR